MFQFKLLTLHLLRLPVTLVLSLGPILCVCRLLGCQGDLGVWKSDSDTLEGRHPLIQGRAAEESVGRCCMMWLTPPPVAWQHNLFMSINVYIGICFCKQWVVSFVPLFSNVHAWTSRLVWLMHDAVVVVSLCDYYWLGIHEQVIFASTSHSIFVRSSSVSKWSEANDHMWSIRDFAMYIQWKLKNTTVIYWY